MKHIKKLILILMLGIFSHSYSTLFCTADKLYLEGEVIKPATTKIKFKFENLVIEAKKTLEYFEFDRNNAGTNKGMIKIANITFTSNVNTIEGDKIYFDYSTNPNGIIHLNVSGEMIFDWNENENPQQILLGYVYEKNKKDQDVALDLHNLDTSINRTLYAIKIIVVDNMDLGKGISGETFSAREGSSTGGHPAKIYLTGTRDEEINVTIPPTAIVSNGKEELTVNLNYQWRPENQYTIETKTNVYIDTGIIARTDDIVIEGVMPTNATSVGKYTGSFVVRAEYKDILDDN